jgi:DmsE family decaheme c-type cytochrome
LVREGDKKMNRVRQVLIWGALILFGGVGAAAAAEDGKASSQSLERDKICTRCHDENDDKPILSIYQTRHGVKADQRTPSCQSCHGESTDHVKNPKGVSPRPVPDITFGPKSSTPPEERVAACLACHDSGKRMFWAGSQHASRNIPCTSCHAVHTPNDRVLAKITQPDVCFTCHKTQRAQIHYISTHPIFVGKVACSDCHNPHGSTGPTLLVKNTVNETCYTCHAEKRGPFLWEHSPVVDDCTNCHTPHGSTNAALLKTRPPWLCQECHSGDHGAAINSGANLPNGNATTINGLQPLGPQSPRAQTNARACLNCHVLIHGSNHPQGAKFQR